jgi:ATP-dependent DNA helicase RecG
MSDHRINKPEYAERAVFEALSNALMHRDWSIVGSEVHVDIFDDRMEIYSPGGMPDGTLIQERDINQVPSMRRNPAIADVFGRLDFAERQGSGLRRIREETSNLYAFTDDFAPKFESTSSTFYVILKNMNYGNFNGTTIQDERVALLLEYCLNPRTRDEMQQHLGIASREHFRKKILKPLLESGQLQMTSPDKPNSRSQKYVST